MIPLILLGGSAAAFGPQLFSFGGNKTDSEVKIAGNKVPLALLVAGALAAGYFIAKKA